MVIQSPIFGELEIDDNQIIQFEKGIPGFPDERQFVVLDLPNTPFFIMQSVQGELYFFLVNPFEFFKEYEIELPDSIVESLGIEKEEDTVIYSIATVKEELKNTTINLQAPIIINVKNNKAKQPVLNDSRYGIRQPIFQNAQSETALASAK